MWTWILSVGGVGLWSAVVWLVSSHRVSHRMQAVLDQTRQRADQAEDKYESLNQSLKNAQEISALGRDLYERMRTMASHIAGIGKGLSRAVDSYNGAVGSMESRVLPAARRLKELIAATGADIEMLNSVDKTPKILTADELAGPLEVEGDS